MNFRGLSQSECDVIKEILDSEKVTYEVGLDEKAIEQNEAQKKETLAHYLPGRVSTNLLSIKLTDDDFAKLSESVLLKLEELGFLSGNIPHHTEFEVYNEDDPEYIKEHKAKRESFIAYVLGLITIICIATYILILYF